MDYLSNCGNSVFPLLCLAVYHSKHPNPHPVSGAGGQVGDWKVRTGVTGETSEHKGFFVTFDTVLLVGIMVGRLFSLCACSSMENMFV